jgi:nitroimidazol reductase NimA-like FMN-containing flavoprotein (pyridoxamine 5'-phosphate oxidase superfamily)
MTGIRNTSEIETFLYRHDVGRIGCHDHGQTYIVPVSYAYANGSVYGRTYPGKKLQMLRSHPDICFEVDAFQDAAPWKSVIAWGHFEELTEETERHEAISLLCGRNRSLYAGAAEKLWDEWPFRPQEEDEVAGVLFRIRLQTITGRYQASLPASPFIA